METTKSESLRARSILQSLVSMNDLEGVLSLRFILPPPKLEVQVSINQTLGRYHCWHCHCAFSLMAAFDKRFADIFLFFYVR